ncbi:MAG: hypothetical protein J6I52_06900 [Prevotella sp.]|nr:hypothetical protein [Prevotella sp.]
MKKLYICPMTEIVKVVTTKMIAASIEINSNGEEVDAGNAAAREGGGFWDDDDE